MDRTTKAIVGLAVGVAGVAAAAGVVAARRGSAPVTYHVRPGADGWTVAAAGATEAESTHATKQEAVRAARELAGRAAPSHLIIHRTDGTIQTRHAYGVDD